MHCVAGVIDKAVFANDVGVQLASCYFVLLKNMSGCKISAVGATYL
jgi:hypothetical protein